MSNQIVHCKKSKFDVYIGRPKAGADWNFGNPFQIGTDGNRERVISKFESWLKTGEANGNSDATEARRKWILDNLLKLRGKILGCWCAPSDCHGRILMEMAHE